MSPVELASVLLVAVGAPCVVAVRNPTKQVFVNAVYGMFLTLFFLASRAPDVAFSQLVVSTVALPLMIMLALVRIRRGGKP